MQINEYNQLIEIVHDSVIMILLLEIDLKSAYK